ncbi:hypothetical protein VTN00DRAFT_7532 [Thermoascus crustaceus]|uniref:uncharacterized protein n=1 Tax=Thermoascus crustaceus TaxID=5088 RepID=UPI003743A08A
MDMHAVMSFPFVAVREERCEDVPAHPLAGYDEPWPGTVDGAALVEEVVSSRGASQDEGSVWTKPGADDRSVLLVPSLEFSLWVHFGKLVQIPYEWQWGRSEG